MQDSNKTLGDFLTEVGDAKFAVKLPNIGVINAFAEASRQAGIPIAGIAKYPLGKRGLLVSSPDEAVLRQLVEVASKVKGAMVERRVSLESLSQVGVPGEVFSLGDGAGVDALIHQDDEARTIRAEFLIDGGFRPEGQGFRTVTIVCRFDEDRGQAVPITYLVNQYGWQNGKVASPISKQFERDHPGGVKSAVAMYKACGGRDLAEILDEYPEGPERDKQEADRNESARRFLKFLVRLTGLVLTDTSNAFRQSTRRDDFGVSFEQAYRAGAGVGA